MPSVGDIMAGRAFVLLYAHDTPLYRGLKMAERRVQQFAYNANRIGRSMLTVATAAGAPLAFAARTFANFQDVMKEVQAVTGATGQEFDNLYEKAKKLGSTTSFTAGQVAEGMANLGRQGFAPDEIDAAIPSVLNLARATKTELATAATIAAGTLRALGMEAKEMPRVADVLTATANNSSQTLEELGDTMKYAAPIADEMGLSIEQTAKAVGVLANMQIKGTMAGTSLRKIMGDLANTKTQEKLRQVGVEALNADGSLRPLGDTMIDLGQAMARMTNAQRISFAQDLFGERAYGAALKLSKGGFEDLAAAIDQSSGLAQRMADLMNSGLAGAMRVLSSATEGLLISIGEALSGSLKEAMETATQYIGGINEWVKRNKDLVITFAEIVAVAGAFAAGMIAVGSVAGSVMATINFLSMAVGGLSTAFTFLMANPVVLALAAITAGVVALGYALDSCAGDMAALESKSRDLLGEHDKLREADMGLMRELESLAKKSRLSNDAMERADSIIAQLEDRYGDLGLEMNRTTGKISGVANAFDSLTAAMQRNAAAEIKAAMLESLANVQSLNEEVQRLNGLWMTPWGKSVAISEVEQEREKELNHLKSLESRYASMMGGDRGAMYGPAASVLKDKSNVNASGSVSGIFTSSQAEESKAIEETQRIRESMFASLAAMKRDMIEDEHQRELANINAKYDAETKRLVDLRKSRTDFSDEELQAMTDAAKAIGQTRNQAIANAEAKHEAQKAEAAQRVEDDIARLRVELEASEKTSQAEAAGGPDTKARIREIEKEKEFRLIELERQRELRAAEKEGLDPHLINEAYDARQELAKRKDQQEQFAEIARGRRQLRDAALAPTAQMGSLEAYQAMARHNDPALSVQKNQLRKLNDIEQHTKDAAEKAGVTVIEVGIGDD